MPTWDQIRAPVERVTYIGLGYLAAKYGWQAQFVSDVGVILLSIFAAGYGVYLTRPATSAARTAEILGPGSKIVTTKEIAEATPNSPNVVSSSEVKVVRK